jgi:hypothetical protein
VAYHAHGAIPIPLRPTLTKENVTVVVPSLGDPSLRETLLSVLLCDPHEVILVTVHTQVETVKKMVKSLGTSKVRVLSVAKANKRSQMVEALPYVSTAITVFADDDVAWPRTLLPWMLAPFEDERYGGVGTIQRTRRMENATLSQRVFNFLGAIYLERRNFDCGACSYVDGGLPCLSGRTVAYRTDIVKDPKFIHGFRNEVWTGINNHRYRLNADDDNFITRWLVTHNYKIAYQKHPEALVETELSCDWNYVRQCIRWSRSNWRSNITSMVVEKTVLW